jgi:hypothetical protein
MTDEPGTGENVRLVACRECGNRVPQRLRRCPACGAREPGSAVAPPAPPAAEESPTRPPARRGRWGAFAALVGAALVGALASAAFFALRAPVPPPSIDRFPVPAAPAPAPEPAPTAEPASPPAAPEPSRSRGRTDWLFFFKTGDQLVRMSDDAPIGMVLRTVPRHTFPDGTEGPAYLVQSPDGAGQRFVDADELERGGRLR